MKGVKPVQLIICGIVAFCIVLVIFNVKQPRTSTYIIDESFSPDGNHKVTVIGNGPPLFPFGPQDISIKIDDCPITLSASIRNDGGQANVKEVVWEKDSLYIRIGGKEQSDIVLLICFDGKIVTVKMQ